MNKAIGAAKLFYFPVFLLLVALISYVITVHEGGVPANSSVNVEVTPKSSAIVLDGRSVRAGIIKLVPGSHTIVFSKQDFYSQTKHISTKTGQEMYAGAVLQPSNTSTIDWYDNHSEDRHLVDGIASHEADYQQKVALKTIPFLKQLPVQYGDGYGKIIKLAPGAPVSPSTLPAVYVTADTVRDRQSVITYIKSRGYDLADLDLVFYGLQTPFPEQVSE